jgi:ABC-2 type transport system ATP-binding protein
MLGFSNEEIDGMYDDIVEFADLHDFMEQKLKNYSSGMQVRLAFSVAIKSQGDILVLDEVLAVGDEAFQKKCQDYFFEAKRKKKTIILVTHSMADVRRYCDRAMLIQDGHIAKIGDPDAIADAYSESFLPPRNAAGAETGEKKIKNAVGVESVVIRVKGETMKFLAEREDFDVEVAFSCDRAVEAKQLFLDVYDGRNVPVLSVPFAYDDAVVQAGARSAVFHVDNVLAFGDYRINVSMQKESDRIVLSENACRFHIKGVAAQVMSVINPEQTVTTAVR